MRALRGIIGLGLVLLLTGCFEESNWVAEKQERCRVLRGQGVYTKDTRLFECFGPPKPFSFKFEINKDVDYKPPVPVKIFEERYLRS